MALDSRNELASMIGIDLPFVHGFPVVEGLVFSQADLQAILHKSSAVLFAGGAAVVAAITRYFIAATNKSKWNRTGFGLG